MGEEAQRENVGRVELLVGQLAFGERVRKVQAADQGGGVHPAIGGDVVAGGRECVVEGHAHCLEGFDQRGRVHGVSVGCPEGGGYELHWCFDLVAEVFF